MRFSGEITQCAQVEDSVEFWSIPTSAHTNYHCNRAADVFCNRFIGPRLSKPAHHHKESAKQLGEIFGIIRIQSRSGQGLTFDSLLQLWEKALYPHQRHQVKEQGLGRLGAAPRETDLA